MYRLVPVSSCIVLCSSLRVHLGWTGRSIIRYMIMREIFGGRPVLERSRRPSRPPASKRSSYLCTHLSDRIRLAAASPMHILRTRTMWMASILGHLGIFFFPVRFHQLFRYCFLHATLTWEEIHYWFRLEGFSLNKFLVGAIALGVEHCGDLVHRQARTLGTALGQVTRTYQFSYGCSWGTLN